MRAFILLLLFPIAARAAEPHEAAAAFLEILLRDTPAATGERVIANESDPDLLSDLRDLTDRHDCFAISGHTVSIVSETADAVALRLDLDAIALLKGTPRRAVPLFRQWNIEAKRADGRWKLVRAQTEERRIAEAMAAAASADEAEAILAAATHVDRVEAIELYSDELRQTGALERLDHALVLALSAGDRVLETFVRRAQLIVADGKGKDDLVRALLPAVEALTSEGESPDVRLNAWFTIGLARYFVGDIEGALAGYRAGSELAEDADDPVRAIKSQHMHTWLLSSTGRLTGALASSERFVQLAAEYGWEEGEIISLFNQAALQDELNDKEYARDIYLRAARIARQRAKRHQEVLALYNAAHAELEIGNYDSAATLAAAVLEDVERGLLPRVYGLAARAAMHRGRLGEADELLRKAETALRENGGGGEELASIQVQRSDLHLRKGRTAEALDAALQALASANHWATSTGASLSRVEILFVLARALRASGRNEEAITRLREAIAIVEDTSERILAGHAKAQITIMDTARGVYEALVELLVARGEAGEALRVAEQMRARGLRALIARGHVDLSASMSAEELAREEGLEQRLVELNRTLAQGLAAGTPVDDVKTKIVIARRELDAYRTELRVAHPAMARRRVLPDASIGVPAGITAVEFVVTDRQTIAFLVTHGESPRAVRLPVTRAELAREARHLAKEIAAGSLTYKTRARRLHRLLLDPLEPHLGAKTLCIIPDVELWIVPFHVLIDARGRHVVDRRTVFYAHSLSLAREANVPREGRGTLLALGNPTMDAATRRTVASAFRDVTLGSLADAETEVRSLARLYTPERSSVYYREHARESVFKRESPGFRVLHVAAHAIVDDRAPLYSAVVLAARRDDHGEDGLLEAREVADLPLSADLAVLSACETARGKVGAGEGVVGLAWAFFAAGCSTTVVSQWKAESRATSQLMIEFHRRLVAGDSPAAALRAAQLALRRDPKYSHPFFWAPFVAIGAADRPLR
jgi:CHAT domain-containing protein